MNDADIQLVQTRIAGCLSRSQQLAPALAAFAEELPSSRSQRELRHLAEQLNRHATPEEIFKSATRHPTWLPLLMAAGKPPTEASQEGSTENSPGSKKIAPESTFLQALLTETAHNHRFLGQQKRVMAYPLVVLVLALGVLVFLSVTVVPGFGEIFDDFDLQLPGITLLALNLSDLIRFHAGRLVASMLACGVLGYLALRLLTAGGLLGHWFGFLTAGSSNDVVSVALFTRRLADLLDADLTLPTALRLASCGCRRGTLRRSAYQLASHYEQTDIPSEMAPRGLPPTLTAAITAGGPNQKPSTVLLWELADMYGQWVQQRFSRSGGLVGPLAVWAAGLVVGFVVLSLLVPLFDLINGLTG